jgi:hypothetical protein
MTVKVSSVMRALRTQKNCNENGIKECLNFDGPTTKSCIGKICYIIASN